VQPDIVDNGAASYCDIKVQHLAWAGAVGGCGGTGTVVVMLKDVESRGRLWWGIPFPKVTSCRRIALTTENVSRARSPLSSSDGRVTAAPTFASPAYDMRTRAPTAIAMYAA
jgi:hypothetical protein